VEFCEKARPKHQLICIIIIHFARFAVGWISQQTVDEFYLNDAAITIIHSRLDAFLDVPSGSGDGCFWRAV